MKKIFLVEMDFDENSVDMFTETGVEVSFDNQLYELKERGHVKRYSETVAYELSLEEFEKVKKTLIEQQ